MCWIPLPNIIHSAPSDVQNQFAGNNHESIAVKSYWSSVVSLFTCINRDFFDRRIQVKSSVESPPQEIFLISIMFSISLILFGN